MFSGQCCRIALLLNPFFFAYRGRGSCGCRIPPMERSWLPKADAGSSVLCPRAARAEAGPCSLSCRAGAGLPQICSQLRSRHEEETGRASGCTVKGERCMTPSHRAAFSLHQSRASVPNPAPTTRTGFITVGPAQCTGKGSTWLMGGSCLTPFHELNHSHTHVPFNTCRALPSSHFLISRRRGGALIYFSMFCPALNSRGLAAAFLGPGAMHTLGISADPQAAPLKAAPFICLCSSKSCHGGTFTKIHHLRAGFPSVLGYGRSIQCKRPEGTEIAPQIPQVCFPILIPWFLTPWPCPDYRVYAAGGMGADLRPHNYLQHYDMLKDIWVSLAAMPTARYAATSFLRGTKIYVLGGRQSKYAINAFEVFDTETRSWTKFPNIPNKRAFSSFVPTEDKLFSLGGLRQGRLYRQPKFMRTVDVFDFEQGGWMKMERSFYLKKRRADFVAGYLKGRVVVAGGLGNQPTVLESAEAFHPEKNKWESLPPMPTPRCACSSIVLRGCLMLAVGGVSQGLSSAVEALCLSDS
uniref:Kelch domain containing 8A n=1 Tax=Meleagris gallopavo TaxID=9103 RepID=A0A803XWS8_MELGA